MSDSIEYTKALNKLRDAKKTVGVTSNYIDQLCRELDAIELKESNINYTYKKEHQKDGRNR